MGGYHVGGRSEQSEGNSLEREEKKRRKRRKQPTGSRPKPTLVTSSQLDVKEKEGEGPKGKDHLGIKGLRLFSRPVYKVWEEWKERPRGGRRHIY